MELKLLDYLTFFLGIWGAILLTKIGIVAMGAKPKIRKLVQLDGVDEIIGSCAEKGQALVFCNHTYSQINPWQMMSANYLLRYIGEKVAALDVPTFGVVIDQQTAIINEDWVREGYIRAGYPERFVPGRVIGSNLLNLSTTGMINRNKAGGLIALGIANQCTVYYDAALRQGAMILGDTPYGFPHCWNAIMCDYYMSGDEINAVAAYVSEDDSIISNMVSIDSAKILFIVLYIGTWIARSVFNLF
jgi:hypothetical protein